MPAGPDLAKADANHAPGDWNVRQHGCHGRFASSSESLAEEANERRQKSLRVSLSVCEFRLSDCDKSARGERREPGVAGFGFHGFGVCVVLWLEIEPTLGSRQEVAG